MASKMGSGSMVWSCGDLPKVAGDESGSIGGRVTGLSSTPFANRGVVGVIDRRGTGKGPGANMEGF